MNAAVNMSLVNAAVNMLKDMRGPADPLNATERVLVSELLGDKGRWTGPCYRSDDLSIEGSPSNRTRTSEYPTVPSRRVPAAVQPERSLVRQRCMPFRRAGAERTSNVLSKAMLQHRSIAALVPTPVSSTPSLLKNERMLEQRFLPNVSRRDSFLATPFDGLTSACVS